MQPHEIIKLLKDQLREVSSLSLNQVANAVTQPGQPPSVVVRVTNLDAAKSAAYKLRIVPGLTDLADEFLNTPIVSKYVQPEFLYTDDHATTHTRATQAAREALVAAAKVILFYLQGNNEKSDSEANAIVSIEGAPTPSRLAKLISDVAALLDNVMRLAETGGVASTIVETEVIGAQTGSIVLSIAGVGSLVEVAAAFKFPCLGVGSLRARGLASNAWRPRPSDRGDVRSELARSSCR